jgi:hypothetical protein
MVSKHSELMKRQTRDRYERSASPSSHTAHPPLFHKVGNSSRCTAPPPLRMHEVGSSSRRRTAPPPLRQEEASSDDSVEMWVAAPPRPTRVEKSSDDFPSDSSDYNDECPHIKEERSYEHCF